MTEPPAIRVLILEDVPVDAELAERALRRGGLSIVVQRVDTRAAFAAALDAFQPDVVLADYKLPEFDGLSAVKLVRERSAALPVIAVTGALGDEAAVALIKAGANDFVLKDRMARLAPAVQNALAEATTIRARAAAERRADEEAAKFRSLVDQGITGILIIREDGTVAYVNPLFASTFGYALEEVVGRPFGDFTAAPDRAVFAEAFAALITGRQPSIQIAGGLKRKDGTIADVLAAGGLASYEGRPAVIGVMLDISDRKEAEARLKQFRMLLDHSNDAIEVIDLETGRFLDVNETTCRSLGYRRDELLTMSVGDVTPGLDRSRIQKINELLLERHSAVIEALRRRKDGSVFPVEVSLTFVQIGGNYVLAIVRDISERKHAEEALNRVNRALKALSSANTAVVHATAEPELLNDMCRVLVERGGYRMAWIGIPRNDPAKTVAPVAWAGEEDGVLQSLKATWADDEYGRGIVGLAIRTGKTQVNPSFATEERVAPWRSMAQEHGFVSSIAVPLKNESGVFAILMILAAEADAFAPEEVELLEELADDLAFGIKVLRDGVEREAAERRRREALEATVAAIASTVDLRDPYTAGHQQRVAALAVMIAHEMGLSEPQIHGLYLAGIIHDVGKIGVPFEILNKPARITKAEFEMIQAHVQSGYEIVKGIDFPWPIAQIVLQHHERLDGSGYPNGAKGDEILIEARILAVADVVEAMQSHRPYREALGLDAALAEIERGKGRLYDAPAVDACVKLFRQKGFTFQWPVAQ